MSDLVGLVTYQMSSICDSLGIGIKSLLMDGETISTISIACPQSALMRKGIYLFERLDARTPTKQLRFVNCICVVKPTPANMQLLVEELRVPRFGKYHVFLTQHINRNLVKALAEADVHEVVASVCEIPLDYRAMDTHLFTMIGGGAWSELNAGKRFANGLKSVLTALNLRPSFCHTLQSLDSEGFVRTVETELLQSAASVEAMAARKAQDAVVFVFDRRCDPVTPLLNQWTYQAMIHEIFGIKNNVVDLSAYDVPKEMKNIVLCSGNDEFFRNNMYKNFGEIGEIVKQLVSEYQDHVKSQQKIDSIGDIRDFVSSYPEFRKMSGTVTKHVSLISEMSKLVTRHKLLQVSEFEQNLCCGSDSEETNLAALKEILSLDDLRPVDVKRMLCLYSLKYGRGSKLNPREVQQIAERFNMDRVYLENMIRAFQRYGDQKFNSLYQVITTTKANKLLQGLRGIQNVYTQQQPLIKSILADLVRRRGGPRNGIRFGDGFAYSGNIVVYGLNGITFQEARAVQELNRELGTKITIGGCLLWNTDSFIDYVMAHK